jgi:hypothetical protein
MQTSFTPNDEFFGVCLMISVPLLSQGKLFVHFFAIFFFHFQLGMFLTKFTIMYIVAGEIL